MTRSGCSRVADDAGGAGDMPAHAAIPAIATANPIGFLNLVSQVLNPVLSASSASSASSAFFYLRPLLSPKALCAL